jgi:hypothetical protein
MQIGRPLRTLVVEPLESPVPTKVTEPEPAEPETVGPTPEPEPLYEPATP